MLIDSHCHLNFSDFADDFSAVIARARNDGISLMQTICTKFSEFDDIHKIAMDNEDIYCSVGVHPHSAEEHILTSIKKYILEKVELPKVISIGETGLDYFYEKSNRTVQKNSFTQHIEAAQICGLPIIVHTRDADADTIKILQNAMKIKQFKGLIHCFTASQELAEAVLEMGFFISISGIATFKNSQNLRNIIKNIPLNRLLIETDSPFLAPQPMRGKRNEPAFVKFVNAEIAKLFENDEVEMAKITKNNFYELFDIKF